MNILLIHQYAGNKGDRAVAYAMCRMLRTAVPGISITISTSSPELWCDEAFIKEWSIGLVPSAWRFDAADGLYWRMLRRVRKYTFTVLRELFLRGLSRPFIGLLANKEFVAACRKADRVVSVGGHHFTTLLSRDLVSSINYDAMAALSIKDSLVCFSQSFGPFDFHNPRNRMLTQQILEHCILMPREDQSHKALTAFGIKENRIRDTYESVLSLNGCIRDYVLPSKREKCAGISIYATQQRTAEQCDAYTSTIASVCDTLIGRGYAVRFFPMELKGSGPDDRPMIDEIMAKVTNSEGCIVYDEDMPTLHHIEELSKCRIFIGHKTHSTVFALASGTPLIGIAYHPKTREFMSQFGVDCNCVDDSALTADALVPVIESMENRLDEIGQIQFCRAQELTASIIRDLQKALK